jgi:exopolysaccharide biosynthesis polyprenyl glycosylphosphotransferase
MHPPAAGWIPPIRDPRRRGRRLVCPDSRRTLRNALAHQLPPPAWSVLRWLADLGIAFAAPLVALHHVQEASPAGPILLVLPLSATLAALLLHLDGASRLERSRPWSTTARGVLAIATAMVLAWLAAAACGAADWHAAALSLALAVPGVLLSRAVLLLGILRSATRRVVLVGPLDCRLRLREHIARHPDLGYVLVAEVGPGQSFSADCPTRPMADLEAAVAEADPDEVLLSTGFDDRLLLMEAMARLLTRPLIVRYVPDPEAVPLFCPRPADIAGLPAIDLSNGPLTPGAECLKWIEDKIVAVVALAILGLPMLLIALAIKISSPGPALFVQERQGRWGRAIRVFKFRTMRADQCTQDVTTGRFRQAGQGDARITPLGRFLRNTSLDELPQFLNVLRGDMSVVGPRPHVRALNRRFASDIGELMRRHYVKPGITGLAQISGARGETRTVEDMRRRVNLDLEYLRTWSLWLDVSILARTLVAGWINRHP